MGSSGLKQTGTSPEGLLKVTKLDCQVFTQVMFENWRKDLEC